jgi:Tfp pilus assembly protein PilX
MKRRANQGMAIISALGFLTVVAILIGVAMMMGLSTSRLSKDNVNATKAQYAAESGIERAIYEAYTNVLSPTYTSTTYNTNNSSTWKPTLDIYKTALAATTLSSATSTNKKLDAATKSVKFSGTLPNNSGTYETDVTRMDTNSSTTDSVVMKVVSKGTFGNATRRISQNVVISSLRFNGDPYAVLSNNVNCIFCHTTVTSIEAAYSSTGNILKVDSGSGLANHNSKERIRVATLESLNVDRSVDSIIAGTLYTRGTTNLISKGGAEFLKRPDADTEILGNSLVGANDVDCSTTTNCVKGKNGEGVNFYRNYMAAGGPDGEIPAKFPLPIPDSNSNRKIDDTEWSSTISNDPNKGYINGTGLQYMTTTAFGNSTGGSLSAVSGNQLNSDASTRGIAGNVVISGNFEVQGTVYVDGDVVISGKMKGDGKIVARGNIYVVGDIKYDCNGASCNYGNPETLPTFAMVAGGNMLVGNYMSSATGDQGWTSTYESCDSNLTGYKIQTRLKVLGTWGNWSDVTTPSNLKPDQPANTSTIEYRTLDPFCDYTKGTTSASGTKYGEQFFDKTLTDTTSESPEFIDPGKYIPYIDPNDTSLTTAEQQALKDYFNGSIPAAGTDQRKSYARATLVRGDEKGGKGYLRTRGSFAANEMAAFNQREYCKAQSDSNKRQGCSDIGVAYQSGYKPRFYKMREGAGIYRCANWDASECRSYGDPTNGNDSSKSDYYVGANYREISTSDITALGGATFNLSPTANWLATTPGGSDQRDSELKLKEMWKTNIENTTRSTEALQIDGTVYSANAVFSIAPSRSKTNGSMIINGSLIAADLGVLAVGSDSQKWNAFQTNAQNATQTAEQSGLRVHYDQRLNGLIGLKGNGQEGIVLTRSSFKQCTASETTCSVN